MMSSEMVIIMNIGFVLQMKSDLKILKKLKMVVIGEK